MPKGVALVETPTAHPYLRVTNMGQRKVPLDQLLYVPDEVFDKISRYIVSKDDVILSIVGTIGSVAIISDELHKANLTENCVKLTELKNIDHSFLYYFLKSNIGQNEIIKGIVGSTQPKLPLYNIQKIEIELPPLQEQKSIASILSALDDKIELNLQMNKTLEEMAMALYKHWFVDFGPFQDGEFVDSELGKIPKGWEVSFLNEMLVLQRGFDLPQKKRVHGSYPVFAASGRSTSHLEKKVNGPGVVTGRSGVLGKVYYIHEDYWPLNTTLWVKEYPNSSPYHAYFLLNSMDLKELNSGSAVPTLNRNDVHRQRLVKPPQDSIRQFDQNIKYYFDLQQHNYLENQTLISLRDTLLPKLISGEVRVKDAEKTLSEVL